MRKDTLAALAGTGWRLSPLIVGADGRLWVADSRLPAALGQTTASGSLSVVIASDNVPTVGGTTRLATGTMTRPNDTTQYAAGDGVTTATSSASGISVTNAARVSAGRNHLRRVLEKSASSTSASFRGWIYQDTPSAIPNDNAAFTVMGACRLSEACRYVYVRPIKRRRGWPDGLRGPITLERTNMAFKTPAVHPHCHLGGARHVHARRRRSVRLALDIAQD